MTSNKKWRIGLYYILLLGAVMAGTMLLGVVTVVVFKYFGVIRSDESGYSIALVTTIVISVLVTFLAALMLGKNIITPVTKLSDLSQRVAKGDFNATLDAKSYISEIQTVIDSFNAMVKELGTNEALSNDFVTNVSHEFKTPIAAIEGYATLLQEKSLSEEEKQEYIEKILYNSKRLSTLTGNILLLSKLETQNIITDKTWFRLDEQIRQCILTLENRWSEKGLNFNIEMDEVWYYASESLFSTVWTNIIGNAIKYSREESTIDITLEKGVDFVTVTVTDEGIGMSGDTLNHMFEKFYQGDLSHRSEGNGLGLTLVRRILDLCNGKAEVKSQLGVGTEFMVYLPADRAE